MWFEEIRKKGVARKWERLFFGQTVIYRLSILLKLNFGIFLYSSVVFLGKGLLQFDYEPEISGLVYTSNNHFRNETLEK